MQFSGENSYRTKIIISIFFGCLLLFSVFPINVEAQRARGMHELTQQMIDEIEKKLGNQTNKPGPIRGEVDISTVAGSVTEFNFDQQWQPNTNPNPQLNFSVYLPGIPAGDINGDGKNDVIINTSFARDERTPDILEDVTPKSAVFYGGNIAGKQPDQLFYRNLYPIGDFNGDDSTDALDISSGDIYFGSKNGLVKSGKSINTSTIDFSLSDEKRAFADFDGDGYDDILFYDTQTSSSLFYVVFGEPSSDGGILESSSSDSEITILSYNKVHSSPYQRYNIVNLNGNGQSEIVQLSGSSFNSDGEVRIFGFSPTREDSVMQQFAYSSILGYAYRNELHTIDINGDGNEEIFTYEFFSSERHVFEFNQSTGQYNTSPIAYASTALIPAGDLNNDGFYDFIKGDPSNDFTPYLVFGNSDLTEPTLSDGIQLQGDGSSDWHWFSVYNPYSGYGDLTGDGIADNVMRHEKINRTDGDGISLYDTRGRRVLKGSESENYTSSFVHYPLEHVEDQILGTVNVGDLNGDGIEDFAMPRFSLWKIDIFFGSDSGAIPDTPDLVINTSFQPLPVNSGDFNNDGFSDIIVSDNYGRNMAIYSGGENMDASADQKIESEDFLDPTWSYASFYNAVNIGDVNGDGIEDFVSGSLHGRNSTESYVNEAYLFFGESDGFPTQPNHTISLTDDTTFVGAGWRNAGLGDINNDGIDDFAVVLVNRFSGNNSEVNIYFGGENKNFSTANPDLVLSSDSESQFNYGWGISAGDMNGDNINDIAVNGYNVNSSNPVDIYFGGQEVDSEVDAEISGDINGDGESDIVVNGAHSNMIGDMDNDGNSELFLASTFGNALIIESSASGLTELLLNANNSDVDLGGRWNSAIGDFDGNGTSDLVLTQTFDNNDANLSSRVYRYEIPKPISIASVEDVPEDQGEWVRVKVGGYFMDAMSKDIYGFDSWSVMRKTNDDSWTSLENVLPYKDGSRYVDVRVPKTQPTGAESVDNSYVFKVVAYDNNRPIAETDTASGYALDNLAPGKVAGVAAQRNNSTVELSWESTSDGDVNKYNVHSVNSEGAVSETPVATSTQNSISLSDESHEGVQRFVVQAEDVNNNRGKLSDPASAVFSVNVGYEISPGWNLISLPIDAGQEQYSKLLDKIREGSVYRYNGSYEQVTDLETGKGYWAKFSSSGALELGGLPITEKSIQLDKGWNLISGLGQSVPFSQIQDPSDIVIDGTLSGFSGTYNKVGNLDPGQAYWVRASEAGEITLSLLDIQVQEKQPDKDKDQPLQKAKENFNRIIVQNDGYSRTLYFGAELPQEVDKRSFSLPPLPPGKAFDARFAANNMQLSENHQVAFDLQASGESPVTLDLDLKPSYKYQTFELREMTDGTVLDEYLVDGAKEVTLRNEETTSVLLKPIGLKGLSASDNPDEFKLYDNYPNPFNPTTTIRYAVAKHSEVNMSVYNVVGQKVATLVDAQKQPGNYKVTFDASNLSSGLYFVKIQAGSYQDIQKLTLVK